MEFKLSLAGAKDLAPKWARHHEALAASGATVRVVVADVISREAKAMLFAWVRDYCKALRTKTAVIGESNLRAIEVTEVANALGLSLTQSGALCEKSGTWS